MRTELITYQRHSSDPLFAAQAVGSVELPDCNTQRGQGAG